MDALFRWFLDHIPAPLRNGARVIVDLVRGAVAYIVNPLRAVRSLWGKIFTLGQKLITGLDHYIFQTYNTLLWIVTQKIPQFVAVKAQELRNWAVGVVNVVENRVRAVISTVEGWARQAVGLVNTALNALRTWALAQVASILGFLQWLRTEVLPRLMSPTVLADWLIGALVSAFWRYAHSRADRIGTWLLRSSPTFTRWLAREIERVIVRLL